MNIIECFDFTRVISLPTRTDRRRRIQSEFASLGCSIPSLSVNFFDAIRPSAPEGFPSIGARGCFLSHLGVLKEGLEAGAERILVLEDDVLLEGATRDARWAREMILGDGWDVIYLGHLLDGLGKSAREGAIWKRCSAPVQTTHGYAVKRSAAVLLVNYLEGILTRQPGDPAGGPMHVDGAISRFRADTSTVKTWIAVPPVVNQSSSRSDIAANRWFDRVPMVRDLVQAARDLRFKIQSKSRKV